MGANGAHSAGWLGEELCCELVSSSAKWRLVILSFMIVRWSWPRFRFDQVMDLAWKVLIPRGLVQGALTSAWQFWASAYPMWVQAG